MNDALDPDAARFLALVNKARPGIDAVQARINGTHFRIDRLVSGCTAADYDRWYAQYQDRALIVTLDEPRSIHMPPLADVERHLADNPHSVVVATWGRAS